MRSLAQPAVLKSAATAALVSSLACYPRLFFWANRPQSLWYLEAVLFLCGIVLWAFVFGWHTRYTRRPVFSLKVGLAPFTEATLAAVAIAVVFHFWLDPSLRLRTPEDYPTTVAQWLALVLFTLAFNQLYLVFAAFAWFARLFQNNGMAAILTVLFGVFVLVIKTHASPSPMPTGLLAGLLVSRVVMGSLSVYFYLRGGVLLAWWWGLLLQSRHLWTLP
jgi:magnesium-transporting ATPase (P-type)